VPLVIMGARQAKLDKESTGALFSFDKPISVEQAVRTLSAARNMILDGRLRYHRVGLEVPVSLSNSTHKVSAQLINLSQGGLQVHVDEEIDAAKPLKVSFVLPHTQNTLQAKAEISWHDERGNLGIRFVQLAPPMQHSLRLWLAQQFFGN
jgi:hypothetical protein